MFLTQRERHYSLLLYQYTFNNLHRNYFNFKIRNSLDILNNLINNQSLSSFRNHFRNLRQPLYNGMESFIFWIPKKIKNLYTEVYWVLFQLDWTY